MNSLPFIRGLPLKRRLMLVIMATSLLGLLVVAGFLGAYERQRIHDSMVRDLTISSRIIADRSTAALLFDDPAIAAECLSALRMNRSILAAGIYTNAGELFASYTAEGRDARFPAAETGSIHRFEHDTLVVFEPVVHDGGVIGTIYIQADLSEIRRLWGQYLLAILGIIVCAGLGALLLSSRLQRLVSDPIIEMTGTARRITQEKDYSARAAMTGDVEIDVLVRAFNEMLDEIQDRGCVLLEANERLEAEVRARTSDLRAAGSQLEAIFDAANVGIVFLKDRVIQHCNARLEAIFGYGPGELDGKPTRIWYFDKAAYDYIGHSIYPQTRQGGISRQEQQFRRKDGSAFWARLTSRSLVISDPDRGTVSVIEDITQEREREEALRRAAEEQQAVFNAAGFGIALIRDRIIIRCNSRMEELFGYETGQFAGRTTRCWYPDEQTFDAVGREIADAFAGGRMFTRDQQMVRRDGSRFWARMVGQALDRAAPAKGLVGVVEDITAEREHAEALRMAKERAESADRVKSAFLATMSHELRTPLNSIIGFTGIVQGGRAGPVNAEQQKQLGIVMASARHLLELINDVLDISKIEAGQLTVEQHPFSVPEAAARCVKMVEPHAARKGLKLECRLDPAAGVIRSDRRRFEQVLVNLLSNAVKFTETGGITVDAALVRGRGGEVLRVQVADTGPGISPEDQKKLFRPFQQVDSGLARAHEGTGLGLSICKKLVNLLGGDITLRSEPGRGSTFEFTLPVAAPGGTSQEKPT